MKNKWLTVAVALNAYFVGVFLASVGRPLQPDEFSMGGAVTGSLLFLVFTVAGYMAGRDKKDQK